MQCFGIWTGRNDTSLTSGPVRPARGSHQMGPKGLGNWQRRMMIAGWSDRDALVAVCPDCSKRSPKSGLRGELASLGH